jgi:hypothetical protein
MEKDNLKALLKKLHQELHAAESMDQDVKGLLQTLNEDIEQVLERDDTPDDPVYAALKERSQSLYAKFAANNPTLEPVLREIGSMLGKMGV